MDSEAEIGSLAERTATHDREIAHIRHNLSEVTDSLTVTAGIQREQAKVLRTLAEHTSTHKKEMATHKKEMATHKKEMAHIRQNLSEAHLWARPFSPETLRFTGTAFKIRAKTGRFSVSEDGTLVYKDPSNRFIRRNLVWRSRNGELLETIVESEAVIDPSLSPDGRRVAVTSRESEYEEIWIYDLLSDAKTRLTFDDVGQSKPTWSPSGREIAYRQEVRYSYAHTSSQRRETRAILRQSADGSGEAVSLVESEDAVRLHWSGRHLVYSVLKRDSHSRRDLRYLELEPSGVSEPITWLATPFSEADPRLSPDGRFLAYASDESNASYSERSAFEIYVRPFPEGPGKWQVSSNGGILPRWRADAKELYYMQGRTVMAVTVSLLASA